MGADKIDEILAKRTGRDKNEPEIEPSKFFSVISADGYQQNFLELRFQDGLRTCFAYSDLTFFNYDPEENTLDLEFGGFLISIIGRGLGEKLFQAIKSKQAAWVKEADSDFEDNPENEIYVEQILISPPEGFTGEEPT